MEGKRVCDHAVPSPGIYWNDESNLCLYLVNVEIFTHNPYLEVLLYALILGFSKVFVNVSNVL